METRQLGEALRSRVASPDFFPPLLPDVSMAVLRHLTQPDLDLHRLSKIVMEDPVLSAEMMRVASSPLYGNQQIRTISDAVVRLGSTTVRKVSLEYGMRTMSRSGNLYAGDVERIVNHAVVTANLTRLVSRCAGVVDNSFYTYGLLHNLGYIVAMGALEELDEPPAMSIDVWRELEGIQRDALPTVLNSWCLPNALLHVIELYHREDTGLDEVCVLALSSDLAIKLGYRIVPIGVETSRPSFIASCLLTLGKDDESFSELEASLSRDASPLF